MSGRNDFPLRCAGLVVAGFMLVILTLGMSPHSSAAGAYFKIRVIDEQTGRGVPLVELRTTNDAAWWTDSNGIIAFNEPGLMGLQVYFHVGSPGYDMPPDFFGNRGVKLKPTAGGEAVVKLKRLNIAERLYRVTGQGIYRDSLLVGHPAPLRQPVLDGQVMGQDTVIATPYRGKIYWFWGDTNRPSYPLGNFGVSGATSEWPGPGGLDPSEGVDLNYFVDKSGFSKAMVPAPDKGMRWIEGLVTVADDRGIERLAARLANMRDLGHAYDWRLVVFNDEKKIFESVRQWDIHDSHESAHPFTARVDGIDFHYLFPDFRVHADLKSLCDLQSYEAFTCVAGDGRLHGAETQVERDASGRVRWTWKAGADRLTGDRIKALISAKRLTAQDCWLDLRDFTTGARLTRGLESLAWNEYRRRWIAFLADRPGEAWFAEADTPLGPWGYARRVVTHGDYNFYNLAHHSFFDQDGGRRVYFEGTYTDSFSAARVRTPRYNYNQIMYRLSLDDERLQLPVPVYRIRLTNGAARLMLRDQVAAENAWESVREVAFFALPPQYRIDGAIPVFETATNGSSRLSLTAPSAAARPLFMALPATPSRSNQRADGAWQCRSITDEGDQLDFTLELALKGEEVHANSPGGDLVGSGTLRDGHLRISLKTEDGIYDCEAALESGRLSGTWRQRGGTEKGTWSGTRQDPTPVEWRSPAVARLCLCRDEASGDSVIALEDFLPKGCPIDGNILCRIWKPPSAALALDWKAQPRVPRR